MRAHAGSPSSAATNARATNEGEAFTAERAAAVAQSLERWLKGSWTVLASESGEILHDALGANECDWAVRAELCREVARRRRVEFIADDDPFVVVAIPVSYHGDHCLVAVGAFVTRSVAAEDLSMVARGMRVLGLSADSTRQWLQCQTPLSPEAILRLAELVAEKLADEEQISQLQHGIKYFSVRVGSTYEEISLIYRLTQNLKLSSRFDEMGQLALMWLADVLPAEGFALQCEIETETESSAVGEQKATTLLSHGKCPVDSTEFVALYEHLELNKTRQIAVLNRQVTSQVQWYFDKIHELVVVPLMDGDCQFGWLAAFNHSDGGEFGTVEASLLNSVAMILGIHRGNIQLFRQQAEMLEGVVRAMTSAIDAKDPYTRGHSDRVARIAVRLAEEMECDAATRKTIYLSGLLHDVGKIGIDDQVLRKPGKLTEAEFEHIKTHVTIGHRILRDLRKMGNVLPVVLHHHESWDGRGYPMGLTGEEIPLMARIVAVADAYDAMSSDRPYRRGMEDAKLDDIIRKGAGRQWDARVVQAFFAIRDDIRRISQDESMGEELEALHWS